MDPYHAYKTYSAMEPIRTCTPYQPWRQEWRSKNRQWDYIIRVVCLGCGKTLGRFENLHRLAFCKACRMVLFPETISENDFRRQAMLRRWPRRVF